MLKLLTSEQMRAADRFTIQQQPISSIDLMEQAAKAFVNAFQKKFPKRNTSIVICCGTGNNGGDGLAIARLLVEAGYMQVSVWCFYYSDHISEDFTENLTRLSATDAIIKDFRSGSLLEPIKASVLIDALFGSGLNRALSGEWLDLVKHINQAKKYVVAIDIPSGLPAEGPIADDLSGIYADEVICFERPKLNFLFPESAPYVKHFQFVPIGLNEQYLDALSSPYHWVTEQDIKSVIKPRMKFSHKGTYGHSLLVAGNPKTMGAALLCAEACLYTGSGLTTLCVPKSSFTAVNVRLPEVMLMSQEEAKFDEKHYSCIAIGPGLGTDEQQLQLLRQGIQQKNTPLVLDADAINLLSQYPELVSELRPNTILTPHMKEFDRLFGESLTWWDRLDRARACAKDGNIIIVLKNEYTFIVKPDGDVLINSTGNAAMASGGMGDVLTGMIASLVSQQYSPLEACMLACYYHGFAGDVLRSQGRRVVVGSDLTKKIPEVMGIL